MSTERPPLDETGGGRSASGGSPSLRDGGPLPRPPFCSFLATTGDPSPNFGGGVGTGECRAGSGAFAAECVKPRLGMPRRGFWRTRAAADFPRRYSLFPAVQRLLGTKPDSSRSGQRNSSSSSLMAAVLIVVSISMPRVDVNRPGWMIARAFVPTPAFSSRSGKRAIPARATRAPGDDQREANESTSALTHSRTHALTHSRTFQKSFAYETILYRPPRSTMEPKSCSAAASPSGAVTWMAQRCQ